MTFSFAKRKSAGIVCILVAVIMIGLTVQAVYFAVGNLKCAEDAPALISENGSAVFIGYYLLAYAYSSIAILTSLTCALFTVKAVRALK